MIAALAITSEYSTGMIRTSLTAKPRRGTVYLGKAIVLTWVTLIVSLVTSFIAFFVGQAPLSGSGVSASLFHSVTIPAERQRHARAGRSGRRAARQVVFLGHRRSPRRTVLLAIIGSALFVTLVALIAFGLGAIVRHTAGAIAIAIAALFVLPVIIQLLPDNWRWDIMRFFPDAAGRVISVPCGTTQPAPVVGVAAVPRHGDLGRCPSSPPAATCSASATRSPFVKSLFYPERAGPHAPVPAPTSDAPQGLGRG